jgi:uncharacterized membrane protein
MENIIVATFTDEAKAIQALHKLGELDREGDINVYDKVLIRKGSNDEYEVLKDDNTNGWRTLAGMAFGGLIGAFGGPIGLAIGFYAGTVVGLVMDYTHYSFDQSFIESISQNIPAGSTSIIAEIDEESSVFIDEYLNPLEAEIWRSNIYFEHEKYIDKQINTLDSELQSAEDELAATVEAQKARISAKVAELKNDRKAKIAEIELKAKERLNELKSKMESNRAKLQTHLSRLMNQTDETIKMVRLEKAKEKLAKYEQKIKDLDWKMSNLKYAHTA